MTKHALRSVITALWMVFCAVQPAHAQTQNHKKVTLVKPKAGSENAAIALVDSTVAALQSNAAETIQKIKDSHIQFYTDSLYAFIYDMDLNMVAHPDAQIVGLSLKGKSDVCGCLFRDEILNRVQKGERKDFGCKNGQDGWAYYVYKNPQTRRLEHKKTHYKVARGSDGKQYIVLAGIYMREVTSCD